MSTKPSLHTRIATPDGGSSIPAPTAGLELRLFGPMEVRVNGGPLPRLRSRKGLWLLALLALRNGRDVDRDWLAGTLWPNFDEAHGRRSLRQSLHDLRIALGSEAWRLKSDEPRSLRLDVGGVAVDALEFEAAIIRGGDVGLETAAQLYRGPLLEDCSEDWALEGRRQREQGYLAALESLAAFAANRNERGIAANHLRKALGVDPFREDLQRALMETLATDGSPGAALLVYRQYRALLGREMAGEPAEETVALFLRLKEETRSAVKPMKYVELKSDKPKHEAAPLASRTLPIPLTALIGRENEVMEVLSLVAKSRLITLTGTGGVGKTRLAIQVANALSDEFPGGVVFADLAPLENPDLLSDVVRVALGATAEDANQDSLDAMYRYIAAQRILLVLDNCEHLGQACGSLAGLLLSRCAGLKILATSRQVLGVKGETVWRVPSLAVPKTGSRRPISAADIRHVSSFLDFAAISLFAERARDAESTFELTPRNSVAVVKICSLLDGIPLAIELAAARVKALAVEKIAERLNDRFRILLGSGGPRSGQRLARHETLRASIDWSYDLLSEKERILLQRLSVFVGGWTLEAAEAVCSGDSVEEWEILDYLSGLVEKSLVVYMPDEDRYRMLETIRQYLAARLEIEGGRATVAARHLDYFLAFAETAKPELIGPRQVEWMDSLESDHDNFRAALSWSRSRRGSIEQGFLIISAIWRFWQVRGLVAEGRAQIAQAVNVSKRPSKNRAGALNAGGILAYRQSDYQAARLYYKESLAIRRDLGDLPGIASTLNNLAVITKEQGDREGARALYEESLAIYRELGDRWCTATCLQNLGGVHYDLGDYDAAHVLYEESHAIHRELGDPTSIAFSFSRLGSIADKRKDFGVAQSLHEESLAIRRRLGDRMCIAMSLYDLGLSTQALGDLHTARSLQIESLLIQRDLGNRAGAVQSLEAFAELALDELANSTDPGSLLRAPRLYGAAEALREAIGYPVPPNDNEDYRRMVQKIRDSLDKKSCEAAWEEGRAMTMEQAISYALS